MNPRDVSFTLLQLANAPEQTQVGRIIFHRLADRVVSYGLVDARGWLDGWWYASGNRDSHNHAVWMTAKGILG
jgi:hypothetical protein